MKCFAVLSLLALCAVATSHGFALKEEKTGLASAAVGVLSNLKDSALQKKESIIQGAKQKKEALIEGVKSSVLQKKDSIVQKVKDAATSKWGYITSIKDAKLGAVTDAVASKYSQLAALKAAKESFAKNLLASESAKLAGAYSAVSSKLQGLQQYKLSLKDKAVSFVSGAASKIHSKFNEKKGLLTTLKKPAAPEQVVLLEPVEENEEPLVVHTYVRHEAPIVGKVFVPEIPFQIYEQPQVIYHSPPAAVAYGPPAIAYGPPADTYGPVPAEAYGPSVIPL